LIPTWRGGNGGSSVRRSPVFREGRAGSGPCSQGVPRPMRGVLHRSLCDLHERLCHRRGLCLRGDDEAHGEASGLRLGISRQSLEGEFSELRSSPGYPHRRGKMLGKPAEHPIMNPTPNDPTGRRGGHQSPAPWAATPRRCATPFTPSTRRDFPGRCGEAPSVRTRFTGLSIPSRPRLCGSCFTKTPGSSENR